MGLILVAGVVRAEETGDWRTTYVKRAFMGQLKAPANRTLRLPTPLAFSGPQVRVFFRGRRTDTIELRQLSLVQAATNITTGAITQSRALLAAAIPAVPD